MGGGIAWGVYSRLILVINKTVIPGQQIPTSKAQVIFVHDPWGSIFVVIFVYFERISYENTTPDNDKMSNFWTAKTGNGGMAASFRVNKRIIISYKEVLLITPPNLNGIIQSIN